MTVGGKPIKPSGIEGHLYKQGLKDAQKIADTVGAIIDITDKNTKSITQTPPQSAKVIGSVADELSKLADLKSKGILTDEEFAAQKKALLGTSIQEPSVPETNEPLRLETVVDDGVPQEVREALENGEKITAVKLYMELTGCGLAEAKNYIDSIS
jgi:ribosomal protein L7/L12